MATKKRVEQLEQFCDRWQDLRDRAAARRDELLKWESEGVSIIENGINVLPKMIEEADGAVRIYDTTLRRMQSYRDRVIAGLDE